MNIKELVKTSKLKQLPFERWEHQKYQAEIWHFLLNPGIATDPFAEAAGKLGGGIYRMYNAAHEIVYVGKSKDIHRRLLQHVGKRSNTSYFIDEVTKIDFHKNDDPVMQTMLEGIFIAYHMPKYNDEVKHAAGKDDQHENTLY